MIDIVWLSDDVILDENYHIDEIIESFANMAYAVAKNLKFNKVYVYVNKWSIFAALQRYSRDIFGFSRLRHCLEKNGICDDISENIINEVKHEHKGIGLRIVSEDPYIHKRIAFFLYYFSIMKPFTINFDGSMDKLNEKQVEQIIHFNSIVLLSCVQTFLLSYNRINSKKESVYAFINPNNLYDKSLIHDLTYRTLNRSSIEAAMRYMISLIPENEYNKLLEKSRKKK